MILPLELIFRQYYARTPTVRYNPLYLCALERRPSLTPAVLLDFTDYKYRYVVLQLQPLVVIFEFKFKLFSLVTLEFSSINN